ncbi:MAG: Mu-like prophage major head subunit gpT family protein [Phycisphaerae bacterium]|nr:Mu-like prophage major head subunit gpT family protein [Phycisphaerae bacterium]
MILIDLDGLDLPASVPILANHENALDAVIGSGKPEVADGKLFVVATLATTESAEQVRDLIKSGVELQASVGVNPTETRRLGAGEEVTVNGRSHSVPAGGCVLVVRGELREVSILPVGADCDTVVSLAARAAKNGDRNMQNAKIDSTTAERERVTKILDLTRDHPTLQARAIEGGWNLDKTENEVLRTRAQSAELKALRDSYPQLGVGGRTMPSVPHADLLASACLLHTGKSAVAERHFGAQAAQGAQDLKCHSMLDLCSRAIQLSGHPVPQGKTELIRAAFSMTDLPVALGLSANKISLDAYRESPASWRSFCRIVNLRDLKTHTLIRTVLGAEYEVVAPGGELKHGKMSEETTEIRGATRGMILQIDRSAIINDDLGVFDSTAEKLGRSAARAVSDAVFFALLTNKTPSDADFFSADNANLITGAGTALGIDALSSAVAAMVGRVDSESRNLDLRPRTLLVPAELESCARSLLSSETLTRYVADGTDRQAEGNPFYKALTLAVEPRLSNSARFADTSESAWYIFSAPSDGSVVVGFLDGRDQPVVEQCDPPADVLGVVYRGYHDFGVSLADHRCATKCEGV